MLLHRTPAGSPDSAADQGDSGVTRRRWPWSPGSAVKPPRNASSCMFHTPALRLHRSPAPAVSSAAKPAQAQGGRWWILAAVQIAVWGGLASAALAMSGSRAARGFNVAWLITANFTTAAVLTTSIAILLHTLRWRTWRLGTLSAAVCGCALVAAVVHAIAAVGAGDLLGAPWSFAGFAFPSKTGFVRPLALYLLWILAYVAVAGAFERRASQQRLERLARRVRESELELLQEQFDPHFLFNTLTLVQAEADEAPRVEELTQRLAQYLRTTLRSGRDMVSLGRQVEECMAYLHLQRARFGSRLSWRVDLARAAVNARFPSLTVQTLVEHAVRRGMEGSSEPAEIAISARAVGNAVHLEVRYPRQPPAAAEAAAAGVATPGTAQHTARHGHGLHNLRRRLELLCGADTRLDEVAAPDLVSLSVRIAASIPAEMPR